MNTNSWVKKAAALSGLVGGLVALSACSSTGDPIAERTENTRQAQVMVRGTNLTDMTSAIVALSEISVMVDGVSVPVQVGATSIDFAAPKQQMVARFMLPAKAEVVRVSVGFDAYGGYESESGEAGVLDAQGTGLNFELPAQDLATSGTAEVSVDLARSIAIRDADGRLFTPHFGLSY